MPERMKGLLKGGRQIPLSKNNPISWLHGLIVLAFMFLFKYIPPISTITPEGMGILGVFLGLLWGWTFCDNVWPSVLGIVAVSFTGYMSLTDAFTGSFGSSNFLMLFFVFILLYYFTQTGLTNRMVYAIINLKVVRGRPWLFSYAFLWASLVLGTFISIPGMLIMWEILYDIWKKCGMKKGGYTQFMVAGVAFTGILCAQSFPFSGPVVSFMSAYEGISGMTVNAMAFTIYEWVFNSLALLLYILIGRFVFHFDVSALTNMGYIENDLDESWTMYQKLMAVLFVVFIILYLWPSFLPAEWASTQLFMTLGTTGVPALMVALIALCNFNGAPKLQDAVKEGEVWSILFVVAAVKLISVAMGDANTGIAGALNALMQPILGGRSTIVFLILVTLLPALITSFCNNLVLGMIFIPIAYTFTINISGVNSAALTVALINCCSIAMMSPAGCVPSAIFHGNKEWISTKHAMMWGFIAAMCGYLLTVVSLPIMFKMF